jgi:hypothetical protein
MVARTEIRTLPITGCSTGGRQGLMEAQRYPYDFDGIVVGAPVNHYQAVNVGHVWMLQRMFFDDFAGMLAFDSDGDGRFDSLNKMNMLKEAVLDQCDDYDGITDGVIDNPLGYLSIKVSEAIQAGGKTKVIFSKPFRHFHGAHVKRMGFFMETLLEF